MHQDVLQRITNQLVFFDLAYLKEIGYRQFQDTEEVYFICALLQQLSNANQKVTKSFDSSQLMGKMQIGICVPHLWLVAEYEKVIYERLL
jgi:hypothetical protein